MDRTNIIEKEVILTRLELKQYFEILNNYINGESIDAELTYIAIKTIKNLEPLYQKIVNGIYNPDNDLNYKKYKENFDKLMFKYADRDEQGEILLDNNKQPIITEQIIEFQNDLNQLDKENKELLDLVNNANENNFNFLNQTEQIKIYAWKTIDLVSNKIPGIIMFFMFKEEF